LETVKAKVVGMMVFKRQRIIVLSVGQIANDISPFNPFKNKLFLLLSLKELDAIVKMFKEE
jgi:hypothetical protein